MTGQARNCARCAREIDSDDAYSVVDALTEQTVWICRVEHIVAWVMRGAKFGDGRNARPAEGALRLTRHRSGTQTEYAFDNPEALRAWASAGGPWGSEVPANQ